jgi:NAD(P)-dependent dehydrogenase (short-subunit alcohol dehydrogenase family)
MRFVVTGAASGIGAATLDALLNGSHDVVAVDRVQPKRSCEFVECDLSDPSAIRHACAAVGGAIQGLANIAGLPGTRPGDLIMKVNYLGYRAFMEGLLPKLENGASVVTVATTAAKHCSWDNKKLKSVLALANWDEALLATDAALAGGVAAYCNSKRLVTALTPQLVKAGMSRNLRFNTVSPGITATPILQDFKESFGAERVEASANMVGGFGRPESIADVIVYLLTANSRWLNGVDLVVDGGLQALRDAA